MAGFRSSHPAGAGSRFGENLFRDHRTMRLMKLIASFLVHFCCCCLKFNANDWCQINTLLYVSVCFVQMETGDPAMNSVHRGLLARSFKRSHSPTSSLLSSDSYHRFVMITYDNESSLAELTILLADNWVFWLLFIIVECDWSDRHGFIFVKRYGTDCVELRRIRSVCSVKSEYGYLVWN